jgi:hypothetical protein
MTINKSQDKYYLLLEFIYRDQFLHMVSYTSQYLV